MISRRSIVVIGQLPPPMSGFSYITSQMAILLSDVHDVQVHNIAAPRGASGLKKHIFRGSRTLRACLSLFRIRVPGRVCYIACEGDLGLFYTLAAVFFARLLGYKVLLHHHSFSYIDRYMRLMQSILFIGPNVKHVFLCSVMRDRFEATYGRIVQSEIISNAAFVPSVEEVDDLVRTDDSLVIGHLSNLCAEKGLHIFLDLLKQATVAGIQIRGILAGPIALEADRQAVQSAINDLGAQLDYRGPVYGPDKVKFYQDIDIFVFPTQYANEAQPTVIFEALAGGARVVSYDRGCIATQVDDGCLILAQGVSFTQETIKWFQKIIPSSSFGLANLNERRKRFANLRTDCIKSIENLVD